jgi:hypothetical protein
LIELGNMHSEKKQLNQTLTDAKKANFQLQTDFEIHSSSATPQHKKHFASQENFKTCRKYGVEGIFVSDPPSNP